MPWKVSVPVRGEELDGPGVHRDVGELSLLLEIDWDCHGRVTEIIKVFRIFRITNEI